MTSAYTTLAAVKQALRVTDTIDDDLIQSVIEAASARIDNACNRVFAKSASYARLYTAKDGYVLPVDDIASATVTLQTDDLANGTFATTWSTAAYQLEPLNSNVDGKPARKIRAIGPQTFPMNTYGQALIKVTTQWGWPAVPPEIGEATRLMVLRQFRRYDSPLGVAGFGDMGAMMVRSIDPDIAALISPFQLVAVA